MAASDRNILDTLSQPGISGAAEKKPDPAPNAAPTPAVNRPLTFITYPLMGIWTTLVGLNTFAFCTLGFILKKFWTATIIRILGEKYCRRSDSKNSCPQCGGHSVYGSCFEDRAAPSLIFSIIAAVISTVVVSEGLLSATKNGSLNMEMLISSPWYFKVPAVFLATNALSLLYELGRWKSQKKQ